MEAKKGSLLKKKKVNKKISKGVQKALVQRQPVQDNKQNLDTKTTPEFPIQNKTLRKTFYSTELPALISESVIPSLSIQNDLNIEDGINKLLSTIKKHSKTQANRFIYPCLDFIFQDSGIITSTDITQYSEQKHMMPLLTKIFNIQDISTLIQHANAFIDEEKLNRFYQDNTLAVQQYYILNLNEYEKLNTNLMKIKKMEHSEEAIPDSLLSQTEKCMLDLNEKLNNIQDDAPFFLYNHLRSLLVHLLEASQKTIDTLQSSNTPENKEFLDHIRSKAEQEPPIPIPTMLMYTLIDHLQEQRDELTSMLDSITKRQYIFLDFISGRKINIDNEKKLIESLTIEVLTNHLHDHGEYQLIKNLIAAAKNKLENIQLCLPILDKLMALSDYISNNNTVIASVVHSAMEHEAITQDDLENILEVFNDIRISYDQYIEELQEALTSADNLIPILYNIQSAHDVKINNLFDLYPDDLLKHFQIKSAPNVKPEDKKLKLAKPNASLAPPPSPTEMTKQPDYPEAETITPTSLKDENLATKAIELDTNEVKELTTNINLFFKQLDNFNKAIDTIRTGDKDLNAAIAVNKRVLALKQNAYRRLLSDHQLSEEIDTNKKISIPSLQVYMQIIDEFCAFGPRTALRLLFIRNNTSHLPEMPDVDNLNAIAHSLDKISYSVENEDFRVRVSHINSKLKSLRHISHANNNLKNILRDGFLLNAIDSIHRLSAPNIAEQISGMYKNVIKHKAEIIQNLQQSRSNTNNEQNKSINLHQKELESWTKVSHTFQKDRLIKYFTKMENSIKQYEAMVKKSAVLKVKYGHSFDITLLRNHQKLVRQCEILHFKILKHYTEVFEILTCMSHIDCISPELIMILEPFKKQIITQDLQKANALLHLDYKKDVYSLDNFIIHFKQGLFFINPNQEQQAPFIKALCLGMHTYFTPIDLINMSLEAFANTSVTREQINIFLFIRTVIKTDMSDKLFHYKGEENAFSRKLNTFLTGIEDEELAPIVNEIMFLVIEQKKLKESNYFNMLNRLALKTTPYLSTEYLSAMLYDLVDKLTKKPADEYSNIITEFKNIIHYTHSEYFRIDNNSLLSPNYAAQLFIDTANNYNIISDDIVIAFNDKVNNHTPAEVNIPSNIPKVKHVSEFQSLLLQFEEVATTNCTTEQNVNFLNQITQTIELLYSNEVIQIKQTELIEAALGTDKMNAANNIYKPPTSIHVNKIEDFNTKLHMLFSSIIFYAYHNGKLKPRYKVRECERLIDFYENLLRHAIDTHAYRAFEVIYKVLSEEYVNRIFESDNQGAKKYEKLFYNNKKLLARLIEEHNGIPLIESVKIILAETIESKETSLASKFTRIGQEIVGVTQYKGHTGKQTRAIKDFSNFMNSYLLTISSKNYYEPYIQDYIFDDSLISSTLERLSEEVKPKSVPAPISIAEFSSITGLINYLDNCSNKGWGYNLLEEHPKETIIEFMTNHISGNLHDSENDIPDFNESMSIFILFDELETMQNAKSH
tara:strand:+ start:101413 stop:105906 length:4494 start_codon:yes stop_codon:yes gene_type:complete